MKGSLSFDPNDAICTQNIHHDTGHVINYSTEICAELTEISM